MTPATLVLLADLHFGPDADLAQLDALRALVPTLGAAATVIAGDLTQRARHGEFVGARRFVDELRAHAPVLVLPGNHDVQWWATPLGVRGGAPLTAKYRRWLGPDLAPELALPGALVCGAQTAHGIAWATLTTRLKDLAVIGALPMAETARLRSRFATAPAGTARVVAVHHNVLPGRSSGRKGLARQADAWRRLEETGADAVLCGHDHEAAVGRTPGGLPVVTTGTHTHRTRGGRPSTFCVVTVGAGRRVTSTPWRWDAAARAFAPGAHD